ncbi:MAG: putative ral secretion pathway protein [Verrucomicrobiota bacterium]|jgi:type II secretory pathway component GspD/PulD (secretin)
MKTRTALPLTLAGLALAAAAAHAQNAPAAAEPAQSPATEAAERPARDTTGGLRFNFRGAPLETVLNYLSEAAGFVIVLETPVRGNIDMWSAQPVSRSEAVQLLNLAINKSGYTATLKGRTLVVSSKEDARKRSIPIRTGNDPRQIPDNAEMVMQIIPLERIDAAQAAADLATLLPNSATITANVDSNSLVVTDTQSNVRHIVELVSALDGSAGSVSSMKVFQLKNADPVEMASLISNIFGGGTGGAQGGRGTAGGMPFGAFGGFGGMGGGPGAALAAMAAARGGQGGAPGSSGRGGSSSRGGSRGGSGASRGTPVVAVPDARTYSVIVSASRETLDDVEAVIRQLDASSARKQKVFVYTLENGDVKQVESVLRNLFQGSNVRTTGNQEVDPLTTRASSNTQATGSNITLGTRGVR